MGLRGLEEVEMPRRVWREMGCMVDIKVPREIVEDMKMRFRIDSRTWERQGKTSGSHPVGNRKA